MAENKITSSKSFVLKFSTKTASISARALADNIIAITTAIERANPKGKPDGEILVNATAIREGSFELLVEVVEMAGVAIASAGFDRVNDIMQSVISYMNIKKIIGEKQPVVEQNSDGTVNITTDSGVHFNNCNNNTIVLLNNPSVNKTFAQAMGALNQEKDVEDFKILDTDKKELVSVARKEFAIFQKDKPEPEHPDKKDEIDATLFVRKVVFAGKEKWGFVYNDSQISADISDEEFKEALLAGSQKFGSGDKLMVKLELLRKFDKVSNTYIIKKYTVKKVLRHIPRAA